MKMKIETGGSGGASGWLAEVDAAINGTAAAQSLRETMAAAAGKEAEGESAPVLPGVKEDLAGGGGFLSRIGQFLKFKGL